MDERQDNSAGPVCAARTVDSHIVARVIASRRQPTPRTVLPRRETPAYATLWPPQDGCRVSQVLT